MRLFTLLLLIAVAVAAETPLVQPGDRVAVFGDSISTGEGTYGGLAIRLINAERPDLRLTWLGHGFPGHRADQVLDKVDAILAGKPTLVTLMFGTNDLGQKGARGIAELPVHLRALVDRFRAAGVRVALLTTPLNDDVEPIGHERNTAGLPRMAQAVVDLGRELDLPVFDMFGAMQRSFPAAKAADPAVALFSGPGDCHPSAAGHALMARAFADFLLGKPQPARPAFVWNWPGTPVGKAVQVQTLPDPLADAVFPAPPSMTMRGPGHAQSPERWRGDADCSGSGAACWNAQGLALELAITDDHLIPGKQQPAWGDDGVELFLDLRPAAKRDIAWAPGLSQLLVPLGETDGAVPVACGGFDAVVADKVRAASKRIPGGYRLRVLIPWTALGAAAPVAGGDIGIDWAVNDRDDPAQGSAKVLWRGAGDDYTTGGATGKLVLE
jgi:lysophospholipase L1-like esterase